VPVRLAFHRAPVAGPLGDLVKTLCTLPGRSALLDDTEREIQVGAPVKCVEK
jgi:hypothetical protein